MQDVSRLYKDKSQKVRVTLVESNQILGSFDERLRKYAEKQIKKRDRFSLVKSSVTGDGTILLLYPILCFAAPLNCSVYVSVLCECACV